MTQGAVVSSIVLAVTGLFLIIVATEQTKHKRIWFAAAFVFLLPALFRLWNLAIFG
jgi:hypothetical protein